MNSINLCNVTQKLELTIYTLFPWKFKIILIIFGVLTILSSILCFFGIKYVASKYYKNKMKKLEETYKEIKIKYSELNESVKEE